MVVLIYSLNGICVQCACMFHAYIIQLQWVIALYASPTILKQHFLQCIKLNKQQTKQKGNIMLDFLLKTNLLAPAIFMVGGLLISLFLLLQLNRGKPDEK